MPSQDSTALQIAAGVPADIAADIAVIQQLDVVPKILEVVCRTTGMGFSAVARVTDTHWVACALLDEINFGLPVGGELELRTTICDEIRQSRVAVAIDHVATDLAFCNHSTPRKYGFQSYISVPILLADGRFFGTLCAIDPRPARVNTPEVLGMFSLFANLIARHIDGQERVSTAEALLAQERKLAALRDQFMAVLGHDLRNPLGAILSAAELLKQSEASEDSQEIVRMIQRSGKRMVELINNVLDFARGAMGGGIRVEKQPSPNLGKRLAEVVSELQLACPNRTLNQVIELRQVVACDESRIGQVLSNLLANALTHGAFDKPIWIRAASADDGFEMSVTNYGATIPRELLGRIFEPFARGSAHPGAEGLGLGLYIASEIARAHGGKLTATSADGETQFVFQMHA